MMTVPLNVDVGRLTVWLELQESAQCVKNPAFPVRIGTGRSVSAACANKSVGARQSRIARVVDTGTACLLQCSWLLKKCFNSSPILDALVDCL